MMRVEPGCRRCPYTTLFRSAAQVQQRISHQLTGTMVGYLAAPGGLYNGNFAGQQQMFCLARAPLSKYWRVFNQPKLIRGIWVTLGGEFADCVPRPEGRPSELQSRGRRGS